MINLKRDNECEVCGKCSLACQAHAISYEIGEYGNYAPVINREVCRECHICEKVCAEQWRSSKHYLKNRHYIGYIDDEVIRNSSTSGGLFSAAALWILSQQGVVIGAAYDEEGFQVRHIAVTNEGDLHKLRKSKYVQSEWFDSFEIIRNAIQERKWILFTGTPCQVETVKLAFGDYDKIFFLDIFCHGVAMVGMWHEYTHMPDIEGATCIDFRHQTVGNKLNFTMYTEKNGHIYEEQWESNVFCKLYIASAVMKRACFLCKYAEGHVSDITIGDFCDHFDYAIEKQINYPLASIFAINTEKGEQLFSIMKEKLIYKELEDKQIISQYYRKHEDIHGDWGYNEEVWERFHSLYKKKDFGTAALELLYQDEMKLIQKIDRIKSDQDEILIYGAGVVGRRLLWAIKNVKNSWKIKCFVVSEGEKKGFVEDIPIMSLQELIINEKTDIVVVAVSSQYRESILCELRKIGIMRYV